jgi:glycosyltransferase involved in cell wall biosynthesis
VSVIATVKNEADSVEYLLDSLANQTRVPDEIVIVDGGSSDGTYEILRRYAGASALPLVVMQRERTNISQGRNAAIRASQGEILATTDAGVRLGITWLEELLKPFGEEEVDIVSGFFCPDPHNLFEAIMGATVLPSLSDVQPDKFLPSSRSVAFRKAAWDAVGGYPEWLPYSEDVLFDLALRLRGFRFAFAPGARVHFRPRSSLAAFWRQYRNYALGDGIALLWTKRHLIRYATYLLVLPALLVLAIVHNPLWWIAIAGGATLYLRSPYRRALPRIAGRPWYQLAHALLLVPVIRVTGDLAKMVGYPQGLGRGLRNRRRTREYLGPDARLRGLFPFRS